MGASRLVHMSARATLSAQPRSAAPRTSREVSGPNEPTTPHLFQADLADAVRFDVGLANLTKFSHIRSDGAGVSAGSTGQRKATAQSTPSFTAAS